MDLTGQTVICNNLSWGKASLPMQRVLHLLGLGNLKSARLPKTPLNDHDSNWLKHLTAPLAASQVCFHGFGLSPLLGLRGYLFAYRF